MTDADFVLTTVARARRRLAAAAFTRTFCFALVTAAAAGVGLRFATSRWTMPELAAVVGAVAVAAAAGHAAVARRSLFAAATALDAQLGLPDTVVAALGVRSSVDPIATLILAAARRRLDCVNVSRLLPLPTRLLAWTVGGVATMTVIAALPGGAETADATAQGGARIIAEGSSRTVPAPPARTAAASPQPAGSARQQPQARDGEPSPREGDPSPREGVHAAAAAAPPAAAPPTPSGGQRATEARRPSLAEVSRQREASQAPGGGAGSIGAPGAGRAVNASGGVGRGSVDGSAARPSPGDPGVEARAAMLQRARAGAEAAIARDEVPPRLEQYVRDYFRALRPEDGP